MAYFSTLSILPRILSKFMKNNHIHCITFPYGIAAYTDKAVYAAIVLQLCLVCTAKMKHTCST